MVAKRDYKDLLKKGLWLYFWLVIFEGALRKWVLPGLASPLLIVRDPIALWILAVSLYNGLFERKLYIFIIYMVAITGIFTAILAGHGNLLVALYGARILLLHFPLLFVYGTIFDRDDVIKMGKAIMYLSMPMALLIILQFRSTQGAFVNLSVGGEEGAGFGGALGYARPSGTFSFTNGTSYFFSTVGVFVAYFLFNPDKIKQWVLIGATTSLLISIPFSISRGLFFQVCLIVLFTIIAVAGKRKYASKIILISFGGILIFTVLSQFDFFQRAMEALIERFKTADEIEGGVEGTLIDRFLGGMVSALAKSASKTLFGGGMGLGTNVGSRLLTGQVQYLTSEGEWGRMIDEVGPVLGLMVISVRVAMAFEMGFKSLRKLAEDDILPWLILSYGFLVVLQGPWAQPTGLGFYTVFGGLIYAALKPAKNVEAAKEKVEAESKTDQQSYSKNKSANAAVV